MLAIRMRRAGSKKRPYFRVVVANSESGRDGSFVEIVGHYNPRLQPEVFEIKHDRIAYWLQQGAQPSDSVRTLLARHPPQPAAEAAPEAAAEPAQ